MNRNTINYILIVIVTILSTKFVLEENSSPVEEMYHRQLVITLDSILDVRFGTGCCKEVIDSDSVNIPQTLFYNHYSTEMME